MPNTNFQTIHQFGAGISQVIRQATGRDPVHNIDMEHVTVAQNKRGYPVQSFMGNPITFTGEQQGYLGSVLLEMFVHQNLNGYAYPWPAGGGTNIIPDETYTGLGYVKNAYINRGGEVINGSSYAVSQYFHVDPDTDYVFGEGSGHTYSDSILIAICFYDADYQYITGIDMNHVPNHSIHTPDNAVYARSTIKRNTPYLQLTKGTTILSYTPYSNICPIPSRNDIAVLIDRNGERQVYTSDFPAPGVYAGTFNMATGELTSTWAALPVSVLEWQRTTGSNTPRMYAAVPNMLNDVSHRFQIYTTHFRTITDTSVAVPDLPMYSIYALGGGSENVYVRVPDDMTVEQFEQEFADAMIVYPVNVPDISQLPKHVIPTAIGTNTVATDADLLEVTLYYLEDI